MTTERDIDFARLPIASIGDFGRCTHCGSESLYTKQSGPHIGLYCSECSRWLRWLPTTTNWRMFILPYGKWRGSRLSTVANREPAYLRWAAQSIPGCIGARCREAVADMQNFQILARVYMRAKS